MPIGKLPSTYGAGFVFGNTVFMGTIDYVIPIVPETPPEGWGIFIYSPTGDYIGSFEVLNNNVPFLSFELVVKKIGGLDSFVFEIEKDSEFPFFSQMEARVFYHGKHWYTGEAVFVPSQKGAANTLRFEGQGYCNKLNDLKISYEIDSATLLSTLQDLGLTYFSQVDISYNSELLNPPDITVSSYEFKNKSLYDIILKILQIANNDYNNDQYTFGVNKNKEFYFQPILDDPIDHFFEGYQFQNPEVEEIADNIINKIEIWRSLSESSTTEYVSSVEDADSQAKYGIKSQKLTISDYLDTDTAEEIAESIIQEYKDLKNKVSIKDIILEDLLEIGFYSISTKPDFYSFLISECDDLEGWDISSLVNASLEANDLRVYTGRRSLKLSVPDSASGEYALYSFESSIFAPEYLRIYINQNITGSIIKVTVYEDDSTFVYKVIDVLSQQEWEEWDISLDSLYCVNKLKIEIISTDISDLYIDRIDVFANNWSCIKLALEEIKYTIKGNALIGEASFGDDEENILKDIKKIDDQTNNIKSIFERTL